MTALSRINHQQLAPEAVSNLGGVTSIWKHGAGAVLRKGPHRALGRALASILFLESLIAGLALAENEAPTALVPENFSWRSLPDNPALQSTWVLGNARKLAPIF
jgi:hypothetical protein